MSKGEDQVAGILHKSGIKFEREKTFSDLRAGRFRYDFYCFDVDGAPAIFEVNGMQHYKEIKRFHPQRKDFMKTQEHDRRKISYALAHNIPIYCIPYWSLPAIHNLNSLLSRTHQALNRNHNDYVWLNYSNQLLTDVKN